MKGVMVVAILGDRVLPNRRVPGGIVNAPCPVEGSDLANSNADKATSYDNSTLSVLLWLGQTGTCAISEVQATQFGYPAAAPHKRVDAWKAEGC